MDTYLTAKGKALIDIYRSSDTLYRGAAEIVGKTSANILTYALGLPAIFILSRRIKKLFKAEFEKLDLYPSTGEEYKKLRIKYDSLVEINHEVDKVVLSDIEFEKLNSAHKMMIKNINDINDMLRKQERIIKQSLDDMNKGAKNMDSLEFKSEDELWNGKIKAYKYRV